MQIIEGNKKFWDWGNGTFTRSHDGNYKGPRFTYKRCTKCGKLICAHPWTWLKHEQACNKSNENQQ